MPWKWQITNDLWFNSNVEVPPPGATISFPRIRNDHSPLQGDSNDNSNDDDQMTVIEMMKMFHRENLPQADVEIKLTEVIVF